MDILKSKFLIADDDADDAGIFCEALHQVAPTKMRCLKVENGKELFDFLAQEGNPDIIFLDINMPIMDGWECLKKLKDESLYKDIPTVMYSTSASRRDVHMAYELGAMLFVTKPEEFDELRSILKLVATMSQEVLLNQLRKFSSVKVA